MFIFNLMFSPCTGQNKTVVRIIDKKLSQQYYEKATKQFLQNTNSLSNILKVIAIIDSSIYFNDSNIIARKEKIGYLGLSGNCKEAIKDCETLKKFVNSSMDTCIIGMVEAEAYLLNNQHDISQKIYTEIINRLDFMLLSNKDSLDLLLFKVNVLYMNENKEEAKLLLKAIKAACIDNKKYEFTFELLDNFDRDTYLMEQKRTTEVLKK